MIIHHLSTTFNSSATPATYEATVRGGTLRHDQEDYSDGSFMPVGIDLSSGRSGTQYFQVLLTRGAVSEFKISSFWFILRLFCLSARKLNLDYRIE